MDIFRIVTVCTGNICRSPLAERLLRTELDRRLAAAGAVIDVSSAGTAGLDAAPMDAQAAAVLTALGGQAAGHVSRRVDQQLVEGADLILTATREHRAAVVRLMPQASRRTFTLREFGRLAAAVNPAKLPAGPPIVRLRAAVEEVALLRGMVPVGAEGDDIEDPYRRSDDLHRAVGDSVARALVPAVALLTIAAAGAAGDLAESGAARSS